MRFAGFDFPQQQTPFNLNYTPEGWTQPLAVSVARSEAQVREHVLPPDGPAVKQLTPLALEPGNNNLAAIRCSEVVNALVGDGSTVTRSTGAIELPQVLSQRANVLSYRGMDNAMCAGFMIATFQYDFAPPPATQPGLNPDWDARKRVAAQDALVGTAFNLARRANGNGTSTPVMHTRAENSQQVHTEQLLCARSTPSWRCCRPTSASPRSSTSTTATSTRKTAST
jgi:hypothetical protein